MNSTDKLPEPAPPDAADEDFVYQIDRQFARAYSYGGLAVIAAVLLFAGLAVAIFGTETLRMARLWIGLVLVFLVGLFVIRIFVARRALELLAKVQSYCLANDRAILSFRDAHTQNGAFQFFASIFEYAERRSIALEPKARAVAEEPRSAEENSENPSEDAVEPSEQNETRS